MESKLVCIDCALLKRAVPGDNEIIPRAYCAKDSGVVKTDLHWLKKPCCKDFISMKG